MNVTGTVYQTGKPSKVKSTSVSKGPKQHEAPDDEAKQQEAPDHPPTHTPSATRVTR